MTRSGFAALATRLLVATTVSLPAVIAAQPATVASRLITVSAAEAAVRTVDPGESGTIVFSVLNTSALPQDVTPAAVLPQRWQLLAPGGPFQLEPRQTAHQMVTVRVPANAAAGPYTVRYVITDAEGATVHALATFVVREKVRLSVEILDEPAFAVEGTTYSVRVHVVNAGNSPVEAGLRLRSLQKLAASALPDRFRLAPGEGQTTVVSVDARRVSGGVRRSDLEITAYRADAGQTVDTATAKATSRVRMVARASAGSSTTNEIPFVLTLGGSGPLDYSITNAQRGFTVEFAGGGAIVKGRSTRLSVSARFSDNARSPFDTRDQYRVAISGAWGELRGGNDRFGVSRLTETGITRLGGAGRINVGPVSATAYAARDDGFTRLGREAGASLAVQVWRGAELSLNASSMLDSNVLVGSARLKFGLGGLGKFDVEYGQPQRSGTRAEAGAWALEASGRPWGFSYQARRVIADSSWFGRLRGTKQDNLSVSTPSRYPLRLTARASLRTSDDSREALGPDSLPGFAVWTRTAQSSAVGIAFRDWLSVERRLTSNETSFLGSEWRRDESALVGRGKLSFGKWASLGVDATKGEGRDGAEAEPQQFVRIGGRATLRLGKYQSFDLNAEHQRTDQTATTAAAGRLSLGATANLRLPALRTELRLASSVNSGPGYSLSASGIATAMSLATRMHDVEIVQPLPVGLRLSVRARTIVSSRLPGGSQTVGIASLRIPFGVPGGVADASASGAVSVLLRDAESGRGVPSAIVVLNDQAVMTDARGRAEFAGLSPKAYTIQVDRTSLGPGRISTGDEPLVVNVMRGKPTIVTVTVSASATLSGTVLRFDIPERTSLADTLRRDPVLVGGVGGFVVEASDGTVTRRRTTAADGRFLFTDLQSGRWTVRITRGELPALHILKNDSLVVDLRGGATDSVSFHMLPRQRTIRTTTPPTLEAAVQPPAQPSVQPPAGATKKNPPKQN